MYPIQTNYFSVYFYCQPVFEEALAIVHSDPMEQSSLLLWISSCEFKVQQLIESVGTAQLNPDVSAHNVNDGMLTCAIILFTMFVSNRTVAYS